MTLWVEASQHRNRSPCEQQSAVEGKLIHASPIISIRLTDNKDDSVSKVFDFLSF